MNYQKPIKFKHSRLAILIALLLFLPFLWYTQLNLFRPPRTNFETTLFQGITYRREVHSIPRPYMLHIVTIDLTTPGIGVLVTPGVLTGNYGENRARTTSEFVKEFKLQLAINGSYFFPFREHSPWDFYPHKGEPVNVLGQGISQGITYSPGQSQWPVLCFDTSHSAQILATGKCPQNTLQAVAGKPIVVNQGVAVNPNSFSQDKPYARMAVAVDKLGQTLWIIVIDGKQPLYSEGVTLAELSEIALKLGAYTALNLDGGGSTTLVVNERSGIHLLNAPIHTKLPMRQRPVANHLGFFAHSY